MEEILNDGWLNPMHIGINHLSTGAISSIHSIYGYILVVDLKYEKQTKLLVHFHAMHKSGQLGSSPIGCEF